MAKQTQKPSTAKADQPKQKLMNEFKKVSSGSPKLMNEFKKKESTQSKSSYVVPPKVKNATVTKDSTSYFKNKMLVEKSKSSQEYKKGNQKSSESAMNRSIKADNDKGRQSLKGKAGYDKDGYRLKK